MVLAAIFAPWVAPYDPLDVDYAGLLAPPSPEHPLGTDNFGRDVLSRIIFGSQTALAVGFLSSLIGSTLGAIIGAPVGLHAAATKGSTLATRADSARSAFERTVKELGSLLDEDLELTQREAKNAELLGVEPPKDESAARFEKAAEAVRKHAARLEAPVPPRFAGPTTVQPPPVAAMRAVPGGE